MRIVQHFTKKKILILSAVVLTILSIILASVYINRKCHYYPKELIAVDSLCENKPDSAFLLLSRQSKKYSNQTDKAYYDLLWIKVSNNLYKPQKDSTIFHVKDYFSNIGDKNKLRESYYYLGKYYVEHSDAPQALKCFQHALDTSDDNTPLTFKSKVYSQSGTLFLYQNMYDDALKMYKESFVCDSIMNDTVNMIHGMRDIAQVYGILDKSDICERMLNVAYDLSCKKHADHIQNSILLVLASQYLKSNNLSKLSKVLPKLLTNTDKKTISPAYCIAAKYFDKIKQIDSVVFYSKELMHVGNIYAKEYASDKLIEYYSSIGNNSMVVSYLKANRLYADSIRTINSTETVSRLHSLYNYNLKEREIQDLKAKNMKKNYMITVSFLIVVIIIFLILCINERNKKRCLEYEQSNYRLKELYNSLVDKFQKEKANNNKTIMELRETINKTLALTNDTVEDTNMLKYSIYEIINRKLKNKKGLSDTEWKRIETTMNNLYPQFRNTIYNIYNVDEREYRICILVKLGLRNVDISNLMYRTKGATSLTRASLYEKFFKKKGSAREFNDFISSL